MVLALYVCKFKNYVGVLRKSDFTTFLILLKKLKKLCQGPLNNALAFLIIKIRLCSNDVQIYFNIITSNQIVINNQISVSKLNNKGRRRQIWFKSSEAE